MKKLCLIAILMGFATMGINAQTDHYSYDYSIKNDGTRYIESNNSTVAIEYSITYSSNNFYFSSPDGNQLNTSFLFTQRVGSLTATRSSNNIASFCYSTTLDGFSGSFNKYIAKCHIYAVDSGIILSDKEQDVEIYISSDKNTMVLIYSGYKAQIIFKRISTRTVNGHVGLSSYGGSNNNSYNNSYNNNNTGGSTSRTCSLCNGSGRCCGAGNVAFSNQYCGGSGRCHPCNGTGWMTNTVTGNKMKCTYCGGSGVCSHCRGTGSCERCGGSGKH